MLCCSLKAQDNQDIDPAQSSTVTSESDNNHNTDSITLSSEYIHPAARSTLQKAEHTIRSIITKNNRLVSQESIRVRLPYKEDDIPNPKNAYGLTKLAGEMVCQENCPNSIIIRTSWLYSIFGNNFVKTMLRLMSERDTFGVVNDQIGSPTYAGDLAQAIMDIVESKTWIGGIYHYSNEGNISWFEFALAIKEIAEETCNIKPIDSSSYPTPAKRPNYSLLDNTKIQEVYGIQTIDYLISLRKMMEKL